LNAESKTKHKLLKKMGNAIGDFSMIAEGDRVMVCLSGGKDSYTLLDLLLDVKKRAPINFDILAVNLDQKQPDFPENVLPDYLEERNVPYFRLFFMTKPELLEAILEVEHVPPDDVMPSQEALERVREIAAEAYRRHQEIAAEEAELRGQASA